MKKLIILLVCCLFTSCSKTKKPDEKFASASTIKQNILFTDTSQFSTEQVIQNAKESISNGESISNEQAIKCVELEIERAVVQYSCLAIWLNGDEQNAKLEEMISGKLLESNDLVFIALKKNRIIGSISYDVLNALLNNFATAPQWLQLKLVKNWLDKNDTTPAQTASLISYVLSKELGLPIEYNLANLILEKLGVGLDRKIAADECASSKEGIARLRCWRILSGILESLNDDQKARLRLFIPRFSDPDWIFFRRNFPHRARIMENNF